MKASDGETGDWFGESVAINGDYLAVGAPGEHTCASAAGATYVFERRATCWQQVRKLTSSDAQQYGFLGCSVAIGGDSLVVSASATDSDSGIWVGAACLFERRSTVWPHAR